MRVRWFQIVLSVVATVLCAVLSAAAAALPFLLFFAAPGPGPVPDPGVPPVTPWAGEVHQAIVTAILATAASAAVLFTLVQTPVLLWRRGAFGLLGPVLTSLLVVVSGFLIRGLLISQAYARAVRVEQAVDAFGLPLTEGLWRDADDVGEVLTAIILSVFTLIVDALLAAIYLVFQLAIQSPLLLLGTGAWVFACVAVATTPFLLFGPKRG
jgi:hypothetical protein